MTETWIMFKRLSLVIIMLIIVTLLPACGASLPTPDLEGLANTAAAKTLAAMTTETLAPTGTAVPSDTPALTATPTPEPATATPTITLTPTPKPYGPTGFPENVNPLTGLPVDNPLKLQRRPLMIKVANYPREGRPHAGLSYADIVFDYWIGEGANRYLALFYGNDAKQVGPIRSGRYVDIQLVQMYQGVLGFMSAWAPELVAIYDGLGARAVSGSENTCPAICDIDGKAWVTSWFADTSALADVAARKEVQADPRAKLEGMAFNMIPPEGGKQADSLLVQFSFRNLQEWRYDPDAGKYLSWIEEVDPNSGAGDVMLQPLTDRLTKEQLAFSNVVVVYAYTTEYHPAVHDTELAKNYSGQLAVLYRDGQAYEGTWKSVGTDRPMQFFAKDGQPLAFKPGNTWVVITGVNSGLVEDEPGKWHLTFYLP
jgi:hypothetical protein